MIVKHIRAGWIASCTHGLVRYITIENKSIFLPLTKTEKNPSINKDLPLSTYIGDDCTQF